MYTKDGKSIALLDFEVLMHSYNRDVVAPMVQGVSMAIYTRVDTKDIGDYLFQQAVLLGNVELRPY